MGSSSQQYSVEDLARFMKDAKDAEKPYVFFTGAGCSVSAGIPLASKIVEELNDRFRLELKVLAEEERKDYGKCMECIEVSKRRDYLKDYIDKAKINWAHIALACLMKEGYIRRTLTFNFDNLLARSCGLLGLYPATYDFTASNLNLYNLIDDPAIVHLHGQGHGFVQLNSESETHGHAPLLEEFVRHTLNESPTLFIGYSGLNDAFFPQIETEFAGQHRLFWVDMNQNAPTHLQNSILESRLAHYISCHEGGSDIFLIELAQALDCFPPTIFANPYEHLINELEGIANYPSRNNDMSVNEKHDMTAGLANDTQDILLETKKRLKEAQKREQENDSNILPIFLRGDYARVVEVLEAKQDLDDEQKSWLARAYFNLALSQSDKREKIKYYDLIINKFGNSNELALQELVAKVMVNKAVSLGQLEKTQEAIAIYDAIIDKFGKSSELALQEPVAKAMVNKAVTLDQLEKTQEATAIYDAIINKFGKSSELVLQEQVAKAMVNKAVSLGELEKTEEAIAAYDAIIDKFGKSSELALQERVAKVMVNKAVTLDQLEKTQEAIAIYDAIIDKFGKSSELVLQEPVAKAMVNKAVSLGEHEKIEEEIAVYDAIIDKFGKSSELALQEQVAKAMVNKAVSLGELEKTEEEIAVYDAIIDKFGKSSELVLQEPVAKAMVNKAVSLGEHEKIEEAIAAYDAIIDKFGKSSELALQERVAKAMVNKAVSLGELEKTEEAIAIYDAIIDKFGKSSELALQEQVAKAMVNKAVSLGELEKTEEAIAIYDAIIDKFGKSSELALQERVAKVMVNKAVTLDQLEKTQEAIAIYDAIIDKFGKSSELALQEQVAKVMVYKAVSLGELEKTEEAIAAYDAIIDKFGKSSELALQEQVGYALNGQGYYYLLEAKKHWSDQKLVQNYLSQAYDVLSKGLENIADDNKAVLIGNLAYTEFLQGKIFQSEEHLTTALKLGGQELYDGTIEDIAQFPVPKDADFKILLDKVWNSINR
ncbi:tetratricopeptide repeat protein [Psychrobacter pygoscelis]|uniref:tetratricopeptide repeat protein n=1 Tax=Psychrobacter pygoscelis TaxID=2488563 RepID=UPI0013F40F65|nr:tetratricopeptide repeat protein [Psychrobacter pygoscelis]